MTVVHKLRALGATAVAIVLSSLLLAPAAQAADSVYWTNSSAGKGLSFAALSGTGGADLPITAGALSTPEGVAINPATNKIYWANAGNNTIGFANLDGSGAANLVTTGATLNGPRGVAINPATNKIYWTNTGNNTLSFANLDNTGGGGQLNITGATPNIPFGLTVDPAANKIYWVNAGGTGSVSFANLDNTGGGGQLPIGAGFFGAPEGVAIDKAAGKIYWANAASIGFSNLDGSSPGLLTTTGAPVAGPVGVAVDPAAGLVYWGNPGNGTIGFAKTDNTGGGGAVVTTGATTTALTFPALLKTPVGSGAPALSASGSAPGSTLSCTQGSWAGDLLASFLFQAPNSFAFQWLNGGAPVAGATTSTFVPSAVGNYSCRVTASNGAGSASQTSATSVTVFKLGKVTRNKKKGTAKLAVEVPGAGVLTLTGKGIVKRRTASAAAGTVKLAITAKGKKKKSLNKKGKLKSKLTIGFTPTGGTPAANQTKKITLRKKLRH